MEADMENALTNMKPFDEFAAVQPFDMPAPGSTWRHRNGVTYIVLCIANEHSERPTQYPPTVIYQGANGRIWSRAASDWHRSMVSCVGASVADLLNTSAVIAMPQAKLNRWVPRLYSAGQASWCKSFMATTGMEPLMDRYEAGQEPFHVAAQRSIDKYEAHAHDSTLAVLALAIPGNDTQAAVQHMEETIHA